MSKVRRIEITIETHEITRIHTSRHAQGRDGSPREHGPDSKIRPSDENLPEPDLILFAENSASVDEVSNPTPLARDEHSHISGKTLNG